MGEGRNDAGAGVRNGRRRKALAIVGVAALLAVAGGAAARWYRNAYVSTDDAYVEGRVHLVSARVAGKVVEVLVEDNQPVKKGDLLLRIDPEPYRVRVAAASSSVAAAGADAEAARSDLAAARSDIQAAEQDLAAATALLGQMKVAVDAGRSRLALAEARLAQAQRDAARAASLFERRSISRERNERAQTELDVARAQRDLAADELRLAEAAIPAQEALLAQRRAVVAQRKAVLSQREARVGQRAADVRQREATLREARLNAGYTEVAAPAAGFATRKSVEVGQVVSPGQTLLAVTDLSEVWIVANFKETQVGKIRPGQKVRIAVDTYPGRRFRGTVESVMAGTGSAFSLFPPENATGNYVKVVQRIPVKILLDRGEDPERLLRVGMSVVPTVRLR